MEVPRATSDDAAIDEAAGILEEHPELQAALIGHTDDQGGPALNKQLSLRRARVVRDRLIAQRIAASRLVLAARGEFLPAESNETEAGRARNRRTEIYFFNPRDGDLSIQYGARLEVQAR